MKRTLLATVRFYRRWISPWLPPHCRFYPSCSEFAAVAIARHGAGAGSWLALKRLLRCHPWCAGGYDPVPAAPGNGTPHACGMPGACSDDTREPRRLPNECSTPVD